MTLTPRVLTTMLPTLSIQENSSLQFHDIDNTWPECYTADHTTYIYIYTDRQTLIKFSQESIILAVHSLTSSLNTHTCVHTHMHVHVHSHTHPSTTFIKSQMNSLMFLPFILSLILLGETVKILEMKNSLKKIKLNKSDNIFILYSN